MRCCEAESSGEGRRLWPGAGTCAGSAALLVLLPKCPVCVALYLAAWTGFGLAATIAANLRLATELVFAASLLCLALKIALAKQNASLRKERSGSHEDSL